MRGLEQGKRVALLISECQRGVIEPGMSLFPQLAEQVEARGIVGKIARLAVHFRDRGQPVVHLHVAHRPDYCDLQRTSLILARSAKLGAMRRGQPDVDSVAAQGLVDTERDIVHTRTFGIVAFHGTELDATLRHMGVDTVVLAGVSTNVAIPGCAIAAADYGYQVVIAEDCIAGVSQESHEFMVTQSLPLYSTVSSSEAIMRELPSGTA
jgi:nicotinamidase-related amidase